MQRGRRDVQDTVVAVGRGATSVFRHKSQRRGFAQVPQFSTALSLAGCPADTCTRRRTGAYDGSRQPVSRRTARNRESHSDRQDA